jgi:hypothetical protein
MEKQAEDNDVGLARLRIRNPECTAFEQEASASPDMAEAHTFLRDTSEATFLFKGKRIPDFLKKLYLQAVDLQTTDRLLASERGTAPDLREERAEKAGQLREWFGQQFDECTGLLRKDLSLV